MKKTMKRFLIYFLCLMMVLLSGCSSSGSVQNGESSEEIAEARTAIVFKMLDGDGVEVLRNDEKEEAYEGMRIIGGDSVVTDNDTSVYLRVDDDKNILLGAESKMNVTELKSGKLSLELEYGNFFFNVENKLAEDETMDFSIGSTSMSIRGTSGAGSLMDGKASFAIYTGKGEISDSVDEGVEYTLTPNTILEFESSETAIYEVKEISEETINPLLYEYIKENTYYEYELANENWQEDEQGEMHPVSEDTSAVQKTENYQTETITVTVENGTSESASSGNTSSGNSSVVNSTDNSTGGNSTGTSNSGNGSSGYNAASYGSDSISRVEESKTEESTTTETKKQVIYYVDKPIVLSSDNFDYDGNVKSVKFEGYDPESMMVVGTLLAKEPGEYTWTITPRDGFEWTDGSGKAAIVGTWRIN